jgi:general secretion pathway protein C
MTRYLGWLANSVFFALCCLFAANTVNAIVGSVLGVAPVVAPTAAAATASASPSWETRQVILDRNLFNASLLAPAGGPIEDLEATRLPLTLLGTVAALEPENAWASIEDRESQLTRTVRVNDELRPGVQVVRIERKRVVLNENGSPRELLLAEEEGTTVAAAGPAIPIQTMQPRRRRAMNFVGSRLPEGTPPESTDPSLNNANIRNPATLFSQARILPKYENGQMVGVQVSAIKPGSMFETCGLRNGDVITEMNGIRINSPEESAKILLDLVDAKVINGSGTRADGPFNVNCVPPAP